MTLNIAAWKSRIERDGGDGILAFKAWMEVNYFFDDLLMRMKYFALMASVDAGILLSMIQDELAGPYFDRMIPNLVRSLIGGVARNLTFFHAIDASGYRFYAEQIQKIDTINPQIASRLSKAFTSYELIDGASQKRMHVVIQELLSLPELS